MAEHVLLQVAPVAVLHKEVEIILTAHLKLQKVYKVVMMWDTPHNTNFIGYGCGRLFVPTIDDLNHNFLLHIFLVESSNHSSI